MKNRNESRRRDIATLPLLPGTLVLIGVLLLFFLVLLLVLHHYDILQFPDFLESWLDAGGKPSDDDSFQEAFFASLEGKSPDDVSDSCLSLTMTEDNLLELFLAGEMPDSLYWQATVTWMQGDTYVSTNVRYIAMGERIYAYAQSAQTMSRLLICDADTVYIQENGKGRRFARTEHFSPLSELGLPSLSFYQEQLRQAAADDYTLTIGESMKSPCICVDYTDPISGMSEILEILPDCGVIVSAYTRLPSMQTPYYAVTTDSLLTNLQGFDTSIFDIPNT